LCALLCIVYHPGSEVKHLPKIFVVDRDPAVYRSLDEILAPHGYDVKFYPSAEKFMAQHHPTQVGCVVIDLMMAETSGSELLQCLHETGSLLAVVNIAGLFELAEFGTADATALLFDKPYEVSTLLTMVADGVAGSFRRRAERHRKDELG
jgi:FixJ family two-component response regulator